MSEKTLGRFHILYRFNVGAASCVEMDVISLLTG